MPDRSPPRRVGRAALGLTVAAVLALTGCTLGRSAAQPGLAPAGPVTAETTVTDIGGRVVRVSAGGPPVELPSGFALVFEEVQDGTPSTSLIGAAVLDDAAMLFAAMYQAIGRGDPGDALYGRYASPPVQAALREVIAVFAANDWTVTGTASVTRRHVELVDPTTAAVSWCADLRSVLPTEIATGHVLESAAGEHSYLLYEGTFQRDASGVWVATALTSQRAAPTCL